MLIDSVDASSKMGAEVVYGYGVLPRVCERTKQKSYRLAAKLKSK